MHLSHWPHSWATGAKNSKNCQFLLVFSPHSYTVGAPIPCARFRFINIPVKCKIYVPMSSLHHLLKYSNVLFRFHFPHGNPSQSSSVLTPLGTVGFTQVADEFKTFKSKSLSKTPGVALDEFGQILKVRWCCCRFTY